MPRTRLRQLTLAAIKLGITASLIYWLLANADYVAIGAMLARVGSVLFISAIAVHISASCFTAMRWWLLLKHTGVQVGFMQVLPSYYLGLFFNNILPTGIGGDVVRTLHLTRRGLSLKALAASMIVDRAIGLMAMLLVATTCAVFLPQVGLDAKTRSSALILLAACVGAIVLAATPWAGALLKWLQKRYRQTKIRHGILDSALLCYSYRSDPGLMLLAALLSVVAQSLVILVYVLLGFGTGLTLPLATYFVIIPIVFVAAMLPISLGGLGVREGTLVGLLIAFGADRQLAIGLSLLYLFVLWLSTLPGAAVLLMRSPSATHSLDKP